MGMEWKKFYDPNNTWGRDAFFGMEFDMVINLNVYFFKINFFNLLFLSLLLLIFFFFFYTTNAKVPYLYTLIPA